jgi:hypothetical protein
VREIRAKLDPLRAARGSGERGLERFDRSLD